MYIVRNSEQEVVAITTRKEDALSYLPAQNLDNTHYTIEEKVVDKPSK
jgi:hypothetical protein